MSAVNTSLMGHLARAGMFLTDNLSAGPAASQATAIPVISQNSRVLVSAANGSVQLPDQLTNVAPNMMFVLNDSPNAINVYPFAGQNMNGVANAALTIAAGGFAFFCRLKANLDWRAQPFT